MKILSNFPYEMFGDRSEFPFDEILSFGPAEGRLVGPDLFPYDLPFDASEGSLAELFELLPHGFEADALIFWWPDQEPIPLGLERCPVPVLGILSDYNLSAPFLGRLWPFFDMLLTDQPGLPVLGKLPVPRVEPFCQFSFRPDVHRIYEDANGEPIERDIDVCFVGNLNPDLQSERAPYLDRLRALGDRCHVHIGMAEQGEAYGRLLARSKIVFNRSIRGEINLRAFEAPACGAMPLLERENMEARQYFEDGKDIVLYSHEDLEAKILYYLDHEEARARIARNAHEKVQQYRLAKHCQRLPALIESIDVHARKTADAVTLLLGRGELNLAGWARGPGSLRPFVEAAAAAPHDARTLNQLGVAMLLKHGEHFDADAAFQQFTRAASFDPLHLPSRANQIYLLEASGHQKHASSIREELRMILEKEELSPRSFDGLVLPLSYSANQVAEASACTESWRTGSSHAARSYFQTLLETRIPAHRTP